MMFRAINGIQPAACGYLLSAICSLSSASAADSRKQIAVCCKLLKTTSSNPQISLLYRIWLSALLLLLIPQRAWSESTRNLDMASGSLISISLKTLFEQVPLRGYFPIEIDIKNSSNRAGSWSLRSTSYTGYSIESSSYRYTESFTVPAASHRKFEVLVPLYTIIDNNEWKRSNLRLEFSGPDLQQDAINFSSQFNFQRYPNNPPTTRFFIATPRVTQNELGKIRREGDEGFTLISNSLAPTSFPNDWRALIGADVILLSSHDLKELNAGALRALERYLYAGGEIALFSQQLSDSAQKDIFFPTSRAGNYGLGRSYKVPEDFTSIISMTATQPISRGWLNTAFDHKGNYIKPPFHPLPEPEVPALLVLTVLALYAALVGPINYFLLCAGTSKLKIFWTTPIISIISVGIILTIIVFKDGVGGVGLRTVVVHLVPNSQDAFIIQTQASKMGLMLENTFTLPTDFFFSPIIRKSTALGVEDNTTGLNIYSSAKQFSGDWFRSRYIQHHITLGYQPTRARIVLDNQHQNRITVLSEIPVPIEKLYVRSPTKQCWHSKDQILAGNKAILTEISCSELESTVQEMWHSPDTDVPLVSPVLFSENQYQFFAEATSALGFVTPSHPSVRWSNDKCLITGQLVHG